MPTEALICPSCRAPVTSGANADGEYACGYCGTLFRRSIAQSPPIVVNVNANSGPASSGAQQSKTGLVIALVLMAIMVAIGTGAAVFMTVAPSDDNDGSISLPDSSPVTVRPENAEITPDAALNPNPSATANPSVTAKAEAEVPASATFEFHTKLEGYSTSYYLLGVITNTSPFVIDHAKVNVVLLDGAGKEVGTDFGFAEADTLAPDESSAIKILVNDPPAHEDVRFEVVVGKAWYIPKRVAGLRVEPMAPKAARFGSNRWEIEGKVIHEGTQAAKFVEIEIKGISAEGKIVGVDSTFADGDVLQPGTSARWKALSVTTAGEVDHFEFSVNGRPAD